MSAHNTEIVLGFDRGGKPIRLPLRLLNRHLYVVGRSGIGKSKFLEQLVRQLIVARSQTGSGCMVIDPHGNLHDALMRWLAASGFDHSKIVPVDLRSDWVCSLNVLRPRPEQDPAPLLHAAVRAVLHGWKQSDVTETPRLAKWLNTIFSTLYYSHCTLLEALDLIRSPEIRRAMARQVEDAMAKSVWIASSNLKEAAFQEELESTMNRLGRFLATRVLRLAFSQSDVSLDLHAAMEKGDIILAALPTEGSRIAEEDAAVVGSLLVNEAYCAAKHRGKREGLRQFTIVIDEFQEYVSPVIAQSLAQLRGMNVGFITAHQSPQQLLDLGQTGRQVLNAIVSNALTQVVFQTAHPADLDLLVPLMFRGVVDADQIKRQDYSTKVLGYEVQYLDSYQHSTTHSIAESTNWSTTESTNKSVGTTRTKSSSRGRSQGTQKSRSKGATRTVSAGSDVGRAETVAQSAAEGQTESRATSRSRQRSEGESTSKHLDGEYDPLAKVIGPEPEATFDEAFKDKDEEHRALRRTIGQNTSKNETSGESESASVATTRSMSHTRAIQESQSVSQSKSVGVNGSESNGRTDSESHETAESLGTSESLTSGRAETTGGGQTESVATTEGTTSAPMLMPQLGTEAQTPAFRTTEEQLFIFSQKLAGLADRHAFVRTGTTPPTEIVTPTVTPAKISAKGVKAWTNLRLKKLPFALPCELAAERLEERRRTFIAQFESPRSSDEPNCVVRRIPKEDRHG